MESYSKRRPSSVLFGICIIVLGRFCFEQFHWSETWLPSQFVEMCNFSSYFICSQFLNFNLISLVEDLCAGNIAYCRHYCQPARGVPAATAENNPTKLRSFKICTDPHDNVSAESQRGDWGVTFLLHIDRICLLHKSRKCAKSAYFPLDYPHRQKNDGIIAHAFWLYLFAIKGYSKLLALLPVGCSTWLRFSWNVTHFDGIDTFALFLNVHSIAMLSSDCCKIGNRWYESHTNEINTANCVTILFAIIAMIASNLNMEQNYPVYLGVLPALSLNALCDCARVCMWHKKCHEIIA